MSLQRLKSDVDAFESAAFKQAFPNAHARKKAMTFAAYSCGDNEVSGILARCVDYIVKHPEWVRRDIMLARQRVEYLRENGHI